VIRGFEIELLDMFHYGRDDISDEEANKMKDMKMKTFFIVRGGIRHDGGLGRGSTDY